MVVPSWQEIIDDIIEVLSLRHPALQDSSAVKYLRIGSESKSGDEYMDDLLDVLVVHKFKCGHLIKIPQHLYPTVKNELSEYCDSCF